MIDATSSTAYPKPAAGRPAGQPPVSAQRSPGPRRGFTLVEMLTVVVIIGILASLITGAVIRAQIKAKQAVNTLELNQLDMAMKAYKDKRGEYPPDFTGVNDQNSQVRDRARRAVLRHLSKAFPRFVLPGGSDPTTKWLSLEKRLASFGLNDLSELDPSAALVFWLGGLPDPSGSGKLTGFSANPRNPFDVGGARLPPLFEFDPKRLDECEHGVVRYFPEVGGGETAPYVYFRGGSRGYSGHPVPAFNSDDHPEWGSTGPCLDTRLSEDPPYPWAQSNSFQIRAAGLDGVFGSGVKFPTGEDYDSATYDDQTNFSGGILENKM